MSRRRVTQQLGMLGMAGVRAGQGGSGSGTLRHPGMQETYVTGGSDDVVDDSVDLVDDHIDNEDVAVDDEYSDDEDYRADLNKFKWQQEKSEEPKATLRIDDEGYIEVLDPQTWQWKRIVTVTDTQRRFDDALKRARLAHGLSTDPDQQALMALLTKHKKQAEKKVQEQPPSRLFGYAFDALELVAGGVRRLVGSRIPDDGEKVYDDRAIEEKELSLGEEDDSYQENVKEQRRYAVQTLRLFEQKTPISCAGVARHAVEPLFEVMGEVQAGHIGDHYRHEVADLLKLPPTKKNLRLLAETETKFWNSDRGSCGGAMMSAEGRYAILLERARPKWEAGLSEEQRRAWEIVKATEND